MWLCDTRPSGFIAVPTLPAYPVGRQRSGHTRRTAHFASPEATSCNPEARWLYNGNTFWSFDDPLVIADKMTYAQLQALGGAFLRDVSGDDAQGSLVAAMSN